MTAVPVVILIEFGAVVAAWAGPAHPMLVTGLVRAGQIAALVFLVARTSSGLETIFFSPSKWKSGIIRGLVWSAGFGAVVMAGFGILALAGMNPLSFFRTRMPAGGLELGLYFLVGGIIGPVAEEMVFRGMVYGFFRRWGVITAIIASTLLFLVPHGRAGFTQAVGGVLFALAYEKEKNLMAPIIIHVTGNSAIFFLSSVA